MALEHKIDKETFEALPEAVKGEYSEKDGEFYLQVVGMVAKSRLDEFRNNNIELSKKVSDMESKLKTYGDITPEDIEDLRQKATGKAGFDEKDFEERLQKELSKRTGKMKEDYDGKLTNLESELNNSRTHLEKLLIDNAVTSAAIKAGIVDTAVEDVQLRAKNFFKVVDGKAVPFDGQDIVYGKDGSTPLTITEWLEDMEKKSPHWFKQSAGAGGGRKKTGGAGSNGKGEGLRGAARIRAARGS